LQIAAAAPASFLPPYLPLIENIRNSSPKVDAEAPITLAEKSNPSNPDVDGSSAPA